MAEGARLESVYTLIAYRGFESLSPPDTKNPAYAGFFVSVAEIGLMQDPVRSTRVRSLGRDSPGRRRRRRRPQGEGQDGPSQSLSNAFAGFFVSVAEIGLMQDPVRSTRVRSLGRDSPGRRRRRRRPQGEGQGQGETGNRSRRRPGVRPESIPLKRLCGVFCICRRDWSDAGPGAKRFTPLTAARSHDN